MTISCRFDIDGKFMEKIPTWSIFDIFRNFEKKFQLVGRDQVETIQST